jgi:hypothetical protein
MLEHTNFNTSGYSRITVITAILLKHFVEHTSILQLMQ